MLRGQTSIELGIILAFLLIVLMTLLNVSLGNDSQINSIRREFSADTLGEQLMHSINSVHLAGDGARKTMTLPATLDPNQQYNVSIRGRSIEVKWSTQRHLESSITSQVDPVNISAGSTINIHNQGGRIKIE